ncbi:hypothetical protein PLESTB_000211600 [Pleodorina starrii]|uniref:Uncharacterized protein n=1 Tax=Pleodorina starrii TaxID=330485 RepID=A0A9W6EYB9_9CHLO|nr:hypothetical protein PLESTM_001537500 [Pleodorina starrii]GLC49364.1 hypothetical protein PLESTB_000211600 [Pleodorina starrii]GLC73373.1 hypothetical protein PLESTF_001368300 [Pleodorina starrii]
MLKHSGSSASIMCSERGGESGGHTPGARRPALNEFKDALFSLVHLCQTGSLASSSAPSPRDGHAFSRSVSIVSDDFSGVPPEEPEWLSKMAAARTYNRALSRSLSSSVSRRDSGLSAGGGGGGVKVPSGGCGGAAPSPLRSGLCVASSPALEEAAAGGGCGASSLPALDTARQALFDRFGSFEGLSAALEDFYHRLCSDDRVGPTIKQVPEQDVWLIMTQLMALSLQQRQHEELIHANEPEERQLWVRRCQALLRRSGGGAAADAAAAAAAAAEEEVLDEQATTAVYDAVMANLLATLERLGALGAAAAAVAATDGSTCQAYDSGGGDAAGDELGPETDAKPASLVCDGPPLPLRASGSAALAAAIVVSEAQGVR